MSCSIISVGKNDGFTEIIQLENYDEKIIELYKKISVNKDGMIFIINGDLLGYEIIHNNVMILTLENLVEMYGSNISEEDGDYDDYLELSVYVLENYILKEEEDIEYVV